MKKDKKLLFKLFYSTFYLSAFTFGGGYVIVPLMKKKFVDQYHWIEEKEMLDIVAISQSAPGPMAIDASILVGYRLLGLPGAFIAALATILPPLITLSIISMFYQAFKTNPIVNAVLKGMQAGIAAIIADVVIGDSLKIFKSKDLLSILILLAVFVASYFFKINVIFLILICGAIGALTKILVKKKGSHDL